MVIHELSSGACADFLKGMSLGRLGCARENQPYVVPISFSFDDERNCVYAFSPLGQKVEWMRENPKVCLEVSEIQDKNHWTTVLVTGRYQEISRDSAEADARARAEQMFREREAWWLPAAGRVLTREFEAIVLYRIQIDRLSGRRTDGA